MVHRMEVGIDELGGRKGAWDSTVVVVVLSLEEVSQLGKKNSKNFRVVGEESDRRQRACKSGRGMGGPRPTTGTNRFCVTASPCLGSRSFHSARPHSSVGLNCAIFGA